MQLPIEIHFQRKDGLYSYVSARLTDEHATSSYGIPVLIVGSSTLRTDDGNMEGVYGPAELRFSGKRITAVLVTGPLSDAERPLYQAAVDAGYALQIAGS